MIFVNIFLIFLQFFLAKFQLSSCYKGSLVSHRKICPEYNQFSWILNWWDLELFHSGVLPDNSKTFLTSSNASDWLFHQMAKFTKRKLAGVKC